MDKKSIIVSHESALSFWMRVDARLGNLPQRARFSPFDSGCVDVSDAAVVEAARDLRFSHQPLHVLTPSRNARSRTSHCVRHYCALQLPTSAFYVVGPGVCVCSPWLALAQSANDLAFPRLVLAATDLCGSYAIGVGEASGLLPERFGRIASVAKIRAQLDAVGPIRGRATALKALAYAVDNSCSPMESKLAVLLCLPPRMGGYSLPLPSMNHAIDPGRNRRIVNQGEFKGDLCWPDARTCVEYNGRAWHEDAVRDERRRNDLSALGWTLFSVYRETLANQAEFDKLALKVARSIGHRVHRGNSWWKANRQLRLDLGLRR